MVPTSSAYCLKRAATFRLHPIFGVLSVSAAAAGIVETTAPDAPCQNGADMSALSPISPVRIFRPNPHLEIAFDTRTRNPVYVMERLPKADLEVVNSRSIQKRPRFYEEVLLPDSFRSRPHHFRNSGYDRGHMAPAADFSELEAIKDTFNLINISPQHHGMNVGVWASLERWVRKVSREEHAKADGAVEVYAVTGPLWLPSTMLDDRKFEYTYSAIGRPPSLVRVPTHFFKVVAVIAEDHAGVPSITKFSCFVVPNVEILDRSKKLQDYVVQWSDLEAVTGLQFFTSAMGEDCDLWRLTADAVTDVQIFSKRQKSLESGLAPHVGRSVPVKSAKKLASRWGGKLHHLCHGGRCL